MAAAAGTEADGPAARPVAPVEATRAEATAVAVPPEEEVTVAVRTAAEEAAADGQRARWVGRREAVWVVAARAAAATAEAKEAAAVRPAARAAAAAMAATASEEEVWRVGGTAKVVGRVVVGMGWPCRRGS